jgi:opacity protein-like surface antigen
MQPAPRRLAPLCLTALALVALAGTALAQPPPGPYQGLFGGDPARRQALDLTLNLGGGWDDNATSQGSGPSLRDPRFDQSSYFFGGGATLGYSKRFRRDGSIHANAATGFRYFTELERFVSSNYSAAVGFTTPLGRRTSFTAGQSAAYYPYFQFAPFIPATPPELGALPPGSLDFAVVERQTLAFGTHASLSHRLSRRGTLSTGYGLYYTDFRRDEQEDLVDQSAHAGYTYRITEHMGARLGYSYRRGRYLTFAGERRTVGQSTIDAGLDYSRAFTLSRRTTFGFSTGSAIMNYSDQTYYRFTGSASLGIRINRAWTSAVAYARNLGFVNGFEEPFFSDAVSASLSGFVGRRLSLSANTGYTWGSVGFSGAANGYDTFTATAGAGYALSRNLSLNASYLYYRYGFGAGVVLPGGFEPDLDRWGWRVGLSAWLPLLR